MVKELLTPKQIQDAEFDTDVTDKYYSALQVDDFLDDCYITLARLENTLRAKSKQLKKAMYRYLTSYEIQSVQFAMITKKRLFRKDKEYYSADQVDDFLNQIQQSITAYIRQLQLCEAKQL